MENKVLLKNIDNQKYFQIVSEFIQEDNYHAKMGSRHIYNGHDGALLFIGGKISDGEGYIEIIDSKNPALKKAKDIVSKFL